jgi:hypothetical protein
VRHPHEFESPGCREVGGDFWFPEKERDVVYPSGTDGRQLEIAFAKRVCRGCIHKIECQQWGLKHERYGIWGALTEGDRKLVRKRLDIAVEEVGNADATTSVGNSPY